MAMAPSAPMNTLLASLFLFLLPFPSPSAFPVSSPPLTLHYHHGHILSDDSPITLHLTFYGTFHPSVRSTLTSFLSSLTPPQSLQPHRSLLLNNIRSPLFPVSEHSASVAQWWSLTQHYKDSRGRHVSQKVLLATERDDDYSMGRFLKRSDVADIARRSVGKEKGKNSVGLVFTADDVYVDGFCMHSCGGHSFMEEDMMLYGWVGNPEKQCPGLCSWPFAEQQHGPPMAATIAPNGIGADGMVMALAKVLAGLATNPFMNAYYYQVDDEASLSSSSSSSSSPAFGIEAGEVCSGKFGPDSCPGFPGHLLQSSISGASYNMEGYDGSLFLVPWIWNPATQSCAGQP